MTHFMKRTLAVISLLLLSAPHLEPPVRAVPATKADVERFLARYAAGSEAYGDIDHCPVANGLLEHFRPDGSWSRIEFRDFVGCPNRPWRGSPSRREARLTASEVGSGYFDWFYVKHYGPSMEFPGQSSRIESIPAAQDISDLMKEVIKQGFFDFPIKPVLHEDSAPDPGRPGKERVGLHWYWDDSENFLCETKMCKGPIGKMGRGWLSPTKENYEPGREYVLIAVGVDIECAFGEHASYKPNECGVWWAYDQFQKPTETTKKFRAIIEFVEKRFVTFAEKNYYRKVRMEAGRVTLMDENGPQKAEHNAMIAPTRGPAG